MHLIGYISGGEIWSVSKLWGSGIDPPPWPYTTAGPKPACTEDHFTAAEVKYKHRT